MPIIIGKHGGPVSKLESKSFVQLTRDLVGFVASGPTPAQVRARFTALESTSLNATINDIRWSLMPMMPQGTGSQRQARDFEEIAALVNQQRTAVAKGRPLEAARALIRTNDRYGAALSAIIDSPAKLDLIWSVATMSAILARDALPRA